MNYVHFIESQLKQIYQLLLQIIYMSVNQFSWKKELLKALIINVLNCSL